MPSLTGQEILMTLGPKMAEKIVTAWTFDDYTLAEIAKIKLQSEQIDCFLAGENFVATYWLYSNADHGIKLKVKESDFATALQILNTTDNCLECGSEDIESEHSSFTRNIFFTIILLFFVTQFLPLILIPLFFLRNKNYTCKTCNHNWK
jgi:hypothetical protein